MSEDFEQILEQIAKTQLGIPTLKVRNSDGLDFHDLSVWVIKNALEAAFTAGAEFGMKEVGNAIDERVKELKKKLGECDE